MGMGKGMSSMPSLGKGRAGMSMPSNNMAGMGMGMSGKGGAAMCMPGMGMWGAGADSMGMWGQCMDAMDKWGMDAWGHGVDGMDSWCQGPWGQSLWDSWGPGSDGTDFWGQGLEGMDMWTQALMAMGMMGMGMDMGASSSSAGSKGQYSSPFKPKASNPPEKVFVGGLPNSTTQEGLRYYFERFGRVRTVELKYDNAGSFRGYGFVLFDDKHTAEKVFQHKGHEYNGKPIDCRRPLESGGPNDTNDNKVFVGGLPKTCTKQSVEAYFERKFGKVASLQLKYDSDDNFRGFAFVTFEEPNIAELACRTKGQTFDGKAIDCRPADSDGPGEQHDKMFVGGLPKNATPQQVEEHFSQFGRVLSVDMKYHEDGKFAGKFRGFCFVQFEDRAAADAVYQNYENNRFDGKWITCRPAAKKPLVEDALDAAMKTQMNSPVPTAQLLGIDPNVAAARVAAYSAMMALNQAATNGTTNPALGDAVGSAIRGAIGGSPGADAPASAGNGAAGADSMSGALGGAMDGSMGGGLGAGAMGGALGPMGAAMGCGADSWSWPSGMGANGMAAHCMGGSGMGGHGMCASGMGGLVGMGGFGGLGDGCTSFRAVTPQGVGPAGRCMPY